MGRGLWVRVQGGRGRYEGKLMLSKWATKSLSFRLPKYMLGRSFLSHLTVNEGNFVLLLGLVRCMSSETI